MHGGNYPEWMTPYVDDLRVCEMYHCTPDVADELDYHRTRLHRDIKRAEGIYTRKESESASWYRGVKRGR